MSLGIEIKNHYTGEVICTGKTIRVACEANWAILIGADLRGADLSGADLSWADLRGAYLCGADLSGADLSGAHLDGAILSWADLRGANLSKANLSGAHLCGVNLSGANLSGTDLCGAILDGAILDGAKLAWQSRDLLSEILRRAAGGDIEKLKVAGLILVARGMCWKDFLALQDPLTDWALSVLREYVVDGDDAPEVLRQQRQLQAGES